MLADESVHRCCPEYGSYRADYRARRAAAIEHERPGRRQRVPQLAQRAVADVVEDDVVASALAGEVCSGVVDDPAGAERAHHFGAARAAHPGDLRAQAGRDLDSEVS